MIENIWIIQDKDGEVIRAYSSLDRANEDMDIFPDGYKLMETPVYHGSPPPALSLRRDIGQVITGGTGHLPGEGFIKHT